MRPFLLLAAPMLLALILTACPRAGGSVGRPCDEASNCADGLSCKTALPGGYCTANCESRDDCPAGSDCVVSGGAGLCLLSCDSIADCRNGYACSAGVCDLPCTSDAECTGGQVCAAGACVDSGVGLPCTRDDECQAALSCMSGRCTSGCAEDDHCPAGSICVAGPTGGLCQAGCRIDGDCPGDAFCLAGACRASCAGDGDCGEGEVCDTLAGLCRREGGPLVDEVDLGLVEAATPIAFEVPAGVFGLTLQVQGEVAVTYQFTSVKRPDGRELVNGGSNTSFPEPLRVLPANEVIAAQLPSGDDPDLRPVPGLWTFTYSGGPARAKVVFKSTPDGASVGGVVSLNVFLSPNAFAGDVRAATAPLDPFVRETLGMWNETYRPLAAMELGEVRYFDLPDEYDDITGDLFGGDQEHQRMWKRYGLADGVNVFFVRSVSMGAMSGVAGISGGIPGPALTAATEHSGIVIEVQESSLLTAIDWCHEIGHFQGLFHLSEFQFFPGMPEIHDPIEDTPQCAPPDGGCEEAKQHLMFPALDPAMHLLSPGSVRILQANAGVR